MQPDKLALSLLAASAFLALGTAANAQTAAQPSVAKPPAAPAVKQVEQVVVTASRVNMLGTAVTASQGAVTAKEIELRPIYRPGQLLETTPGLVVTAHSGEGKANQYLVRGFNLDHGTDIANFIDDMPINRPTNAHGQGYSDVNFFMPEVASGLDFTKGPYYANVGDFGSVASTHVKLLNELPNQLAVTGGTLGMYNVFAGGTHRFSDDDRLLGAVYYGHVDGPWDHPDDFRKSTAIARYSHGTAAEGWNVTGMYMKNQGNFTTDQPQRAIDAGLISRNGTLNPTDGNSSERASLSAHWAHQADNWQFAASGYYIHSRMTLWNDFTHFVDDPVNGDQEQQDEVRDTSGGQASATWRAMFGGLQSDTTFGLQFRHDDLYIDKRHTIARTPLPYCSQLGDSSLGAGPDAPAPSTLAQLAGDPRYDFQATATLKACNADRVQLNDLGGYVENTTRWTPWLRTVIGLREEYYQANDHSLLTGFQGSASQTLFQPKGSLVVGPFYKTEFYVSGGRGFHSDDVRGVFGTVPVEGFPEGLGKTPLMAQSEGYEFGIRTKIIPRFDVQVALFQEDFKSELTYNADSGHDEASAPSRRQGVEFSAQYRPNRFIEFNTDLAFSKARYTSDLAAFGLDGPYIANAPTFIGSFGILVDNFGPWFGGLQWRDLGPYPILDGQNTPQDKGYSEFNVDLGYKVNAHLKLQATAFNLLNTKANSAAYYYAGRLRGEPVDGVNDFQVHAIEPLSGSLKVTWTF